MTGLPHRLRALPAALLRAAVVVTLSVGPVEASAGDDPTGTTAAGVYTRSQAESGEALYEQHCLVCHDKKYFRPVLKRWEGQQASTFFDVMAGSMPESNPGGLLDDEYLDILAYILSRSRLPAGDEPLTFDDLSGITIAH